MATTNASRELLNNVIEAYGGLGRFERVHHFDITIAVSGLLWIRVGYPAHRIVSVTVTAKPPKVTLHNLDGDENNAAVLWVWTPQCVWKENDEGTVIDERDMPRKSFETLTATSKWDHLQLLYFSGYAIWNYVTAPFHFTWPGMSYRELEGHFEANQIWRVLEVTYPGDIPTHCKTQKFYFDNSYRLRRLDYAAEVTKGPPVAHYCFGHRVVGGIQFPMLRRAIGNPDGIEQGGPTLVMLNFLDLAVEYAEDEQAKAAL